MDVACNNKGCPVQSQLRSFTAVCVINATDPGDLELEAQPAVQFNLCDQCFGDRPHMGQCALCNRYMLDLWLTKAGLEYCRLCVDDQFLTAMLVEAGCDATEDVVALVTGPSAEPLACPGRYPTVGDFLAAAVTRAVDTAAAETRRKNLRVRAVRDANVDILCRRLGCCAVEAEGVAVELRDDRVLPDDLPRMSWADALQVLVEHLK